MLKATALDALSVVANAIKDANLEAAKAPPPPERDPPARARDLEELEQRVLERLTGRIAGLLVLLAAYLTLLHLVLR